MAWLTKKNDLWYHLLITFHPAVQTITITENASGSLKEANYNLKLMFYSDHLICTTIWGTNRGKIRSISFSVKKKWAHKLFHVVQLADSMAAEEPAELGNYKDMERFNKDFFN